MSGEKPSLAATERSGQNHVMHSATVDSPVVTDTTRRYELFARLANRTSDVRYAPPNEILSECYSLGV